MFNLILLLTRYKRIILTASILFSIYVFIFINRPYIPTLNVKSNLKDQRVVSRNELAPKLAIIVPFRDRFDELIIFVPHLSRFLNAQNIGPYKIYIINQSSRYRFNRGALANVGYTLVKDSCDYIAIHDIDILPLNDNLSYAYPEKGPHHLTSPEYHPQYNYERYFGGILLISNKHFELVNGMSNRYFGWGLEDDEFYTRVRAAKLSIFRPENLSTNKNNTFLHIHYKNRKRDTFKTKDQKEIIRRRDRTTGLNDIKYSMTSSHNLTIDKYYDCTIYNVELYCDTKLTPWCSYNYLSIEKQKLDQQVLRDQKTKQKISSIIKETIISSNEMTSTESIRLGL